MAAEEAVDLSTISSEPEAAQVALHLGAKRVAYGHLEGSAGSWRLRIYASNPSAKKQDVRILKLSGGTASAAEEGGLAMAKLVAGLDGVDLGPGARAVSPKTASDAAANQYALCLGLLMPQPIGIENPTVLREADITQAIDACGDALEADPGYDAARAALGLALALSADDAKAVATLSTLRPSEDYLPLFWVARFWLVTRFQSNAAGEAVLREAVQRHPGFLLARGYLGELLNVLGRQPEALVVWNEYLEISPRSPFALAKVGKTLARQQQFAEAIEKTREAIRADPKSRELELQLASRYIDAERYELALDLLEPASKQPGVRPETLVRTGYAYLRNEQLDKAEAALQRALAEAKGPADWRVRGRANYDLALVSAKRNVAAQAREFLLAAWREGFRPKKLEPELKVIAAKADAEALKAERADASVAGKLAPVAAPREASLFAVDSAGEMDVARAKPQPPRGFEVLRFGAK